MAGRPRLTLLTQDPPPRPWIRLEWSGDVDAFSVRPLATALRQAWAQDPVALEVDLAGVTFMDSSGLRPLVDAHARLRRRLRLFDPSPAVTRLLRALGLQGMFLVVRPVAAGSAADAIDPPSSHRATVEQAKGVLMAVHGCDASAAWRILRTHAEAHGVGPVGMATLIVAHAPGAPPPASQSVVEDVMAERARAGSPAG